MLLGLARVVIVPGTVPSWPRSAPVAAAQSRTTMAVATFVILPIWSRRVAFAESRTVPVVASAMSHAAALIATGPERLIGANWAWTTVGHVIPHTIRESPKTRTVRFIELQKSETYWRGRARQAWTAVERRRDLWKVVPCD